MLEPVKNWYNVTFDVAFWVVMHLFVRGAFQDIKVSILKKSFPLLLTFLTSCHRPKKTLSRAKNVACSSNPSFWINHRKLILYYIN